MEQAVWTHVSHNPISSMWNLQGVSVKEVAKRTWQGIDEDNLFGRASQLAYSFFSAIFPALIAMSSIMGLIAKSSGHLYVLLLHKIGALIPPSAFQLVLQTFQSTTSASTGSKVLVGVVVALFSASTGVAAVQDTLNTVYRVKETRPFWKSRLEAAGLTVLVAAIVIFATLTLFSGDLAANWLDHRFIGSFALAIVVRITAWSLASLLMVLSFEVMYYYCPDVKNKRWRWFTPGGLVGLLGWVIGSLALRIYLHWFGNYSATYGTLGAVIILLLWFYVTGVMILLGGEVNSEIEHAVAERIVLQGAPVEAAASK
ncbi:YihY/virulence factor BrkB family protein [Terriglobus aquaticus]